MARVFARFLAVVSKSVRTYGFVSSWNDHCELKRSLYKVRSEEVLIITLWSSSNLKIRASCKVYSLFDLIKSIFCVTIGENDSDHGSVYESNSSFQQKG